MSAGGIPKTSDSAWLAADVVGHGPRLVLVHGFTQTRRTWGPVADDLGTDRELVLVDAPGHGESASVAADLEDGAELLARFGPAGFLGYSLGGRFCLHLALSHPAMVLALVVVGTTAGIENSTERAARLATDASLARRLAEQGVGPFIDEWLAGPLFDHLTAEQSFAAERRANKVEGLISSLTLAGTGTQEPLWARLPELDMPVLCVAGELDTRFAALAFRLADAIGANAEVAIMKGAGHACHLEAPDAFAAAVGPWLRANGC